ncbi:type IV pili methyl-accepting chemotaxis transducer N-terminal domain-containing protein [Lyngbya sp. CCAP 1446/10]|uniref:ATP-binding protein n=1 Tax=Lyngbya sp. CCAP 1446/10 TaxID=439293 RepID=UPI002238D12D|nr:ATP-binding protein [Lyngbya sp. CCAP 1446/10]MCW6051100.1 type IV pili methyl-accepting chemotaxis transducer N-terminal domain-containing protein [Lyngbya sp. CCAP 1446/10]
MAIKYCVSTSYKHLVDSGVLRMAALSNYFNLEEITTARKVSAAVINISGRQRMLSQRSAFFCMRLVASENTAERAKLRGNLLEAIELMEKSHHDLINTDSSNLLSSPSPTVKAMYFEAPLYLDKQVRKYIDRIKALVQVPDTELNLENPHLQYIIEAAGGELPAAFDAVVSQYQQESEIEQFEIDLKQVELYQESCAATSKAEAQAAQIDSALRELKQTQAQLLHSEKMSSLGALMASIVHEINNPVSFIYGNLSHAEIYTQDLLYLLRLYREYYPNPCAEIQDQIEEMDLEFLVEDLPKVMSSMQMGSIRIREIVKSMGSFSRTDNSNMTPCDLHDSIDSTILILRNRLNAKKDRCEIQIVKNYEKLPGVECYAGQINQVFMNLISNAIDALEEVAENQPNAQLKISIRTEVVGCDRVRVRIADTGSGMTAEVKKRMFEQFFTTKAIGRGTGLGLSIVYKILVENHRGTLRCESEPGKGTEFIIELPIQQT